MASARSPIREIARRIPCTLGFNSHCQGDGLLEAVTIEVGLHFQKPSTVSLALGDHGAQAAPTVETGADLALVGVAQELEGLEQGALAAAVGPDQYVQWAKGQIQATENPEVAKDYARKTFFIVPREPNWGRIMGRTTFLTLRHSRALMDTSGNASALFELLAIIFKRCEQT